MKKIWKWSKNMLSNRQKKWKTPNMLRMMKDEDSKDINEILDELKRFPCRGIGLFQPLL